MYTAAQLCLKTITRPREKFAKYHCLQWGSLANNSRARTPSCFVCDGWCVCEQVIKSVLPHGATCKTQAGLHPLQPHSRIQLGLLSTNYVPYTSAFQNLKKKGLLSSLRITSPRINGLLCNWTSSWVPWQGETRWVKFVLTEHQS